MKSQTDLTALYRAIPSVQDLLNSPQFHSYAIHSKYLKSIIQQEVDALRAYISENIQKQNLTPEAIPGLLQESIHSRLERLLRPGLQRVVNATGVLLHTNLGRAPLANIAREALQAVTEFYCNLEIDLNSGRRGRRAQHLEELLCILTGAEAGLVVNNNAAAVLLTLNTLCKGKEVPVSRGELVEIGGAFRMPDVMKASGARMVGVGTTNKTHLEDYETAISSKTGALLKVHTSNYRIQGFTSDVSIPELVILAHQHRLPLIYDMGSGVIEDLRQWGFPYEPVAREMIEAGVDVVTFSGDKVLGGAQAGIIIGKQAFIQRIQRNHLLRALRCDKLTYAVLEATLRLYLQPDSLPRHLPVYNILTCTLSELKRRARWIASQILSDKLQIEVVEVESRMGSGALPIEEIPSMAVRITATKLSPMKLARRLRDHEPPIVGYVHEEALFLNLRTVREDEVPIIVEALKSV